METITFWIECINKKLALQPDLQSRQLRHSNCGQKNTGFILHLCLQGVWNAEVIFE